jgi:hypothetical protein
MGFLSPAGLGMMRVRFQITSPLLPAHSGLEHGTAITLAGDQEKKLAQSDFAEAKRIERLRGNTSR